LVDAEARLLPFTEKISIHNPTPQEEKEKE
jgi:hypothetical protein